ncbi:Ubiquinone/menaquinone biosynthesis C-methylase UbiE [Eubacterium ruminantium]|uniref:Ubiquinone/menaquinone biosynthesis C-methylase UbiE n=1 Tax=Eubacterium ruminantium TaxID=42322 RepID=A0A1T4K782_9FIRM|nr:class I SAM-dependent methyltransferase [Eubacterium ruminantium]SCW27118.1 Ubiquinone/menaquinone biosynthesis C-methylase UbiE [Eubacterium ruminantium]SDM19171.1 Ubiquinone/menaquinone biosynthesis C-methylase UbiE [Eubacterium ruminantium]SJZ38310.1 Ubiquinone/menaquinone biosynthesis C-methylase UbiE [Eubacterium ruminantium]
MDTTYSKFALVYDNLMDNIPYDEWTSYLKKLLDDYDIKEGIIAELGCGTGNITERLAEYGYDMIGIDNSPEMLDIAMQKGAANKSSSLYLCQDMREFELYGTVRAVISLCDSINYITDKDDLVTIMRLVNNYLDPGGLFIFDFNTLHYYRDVVADNTIAEDRDDISFIWDNYFDEDTNINELALSLFVKDKESESDDIYKKYSELHLQKAYTLDEIKEAIAASGLEFITAFNAFTSNAPDEDSERIYIIAREKGKNV